MADTHDTERSIGRLEGQLAIITGQLSRVLDGQANAVAQLQAHGEHDNQIAAEIKDALGLHRDRIAQVEKATETIDTRVESHGDAIRTMEDRLALQEEAARSHAAIAAAIQANNKRWIAAATAAGGVAGVGTHGIWLKLWAGIVSLFK